MTTARAETDEELAKAFFDVVNMTPHALETWLNSDESKAAGQRKDGESESTGHKSGEAILAILARGRHDGFDADAVSQMKRTVSYVKRHLAQKPARAEEHSRWAASLKNWGHDPFK